MSDLGLDSVLKSKRFLLVLGAGGVGKTTTSIALAIAMAQNGKRVALISIDPAKRLAQALGISLTSELRDITALKGRLSGGKISAAMLDQKAVFDEMVMRFVASPELQRKIFANSLYKAASTNLGGPLEYLALAKLAALEDSTEYDVIIVDTPPDTHALDFLNRPNILNGFMENRVMTWLIKPFVLAQRIGLGKILSFGGRMMRGISEVTGVQALTAMAEFLVLMQDVIKGFHSAGEKVIKILRRAECGFVIVASPSSSSLFTASELSNELASMDLLPSLFIMNKCVPRMVADEVRSVKGGALPPSQILEGLRSRVDAESSAEHRIHQIPPQTRGGAGLLKVPELTTDVQTIDGLWELVRILRSEPITCA